MAITIRKATLSDLDEIVRLEQESFTSEAWPRSAFEYIIKNEEGVHTVLIAELDGEVCGYMCGQVVFGEGEIGSIAVDKRFRRQGVGRRLLTAFEEMTRPQSVFLEVRVSNSAARALYSGLGFCEIAVRRGYYDMPPEDAVIMKKGV